MLKLINVKQNNGIISADYIPENEEDVGSVSIDIETMEVVKSNPSKYEGEFHCYLNHAIDALKKVVEAEEVPEEKLVMWY